MEGKGDSSKCQRDPFAARAWEIHPRNSQRLKSHLLKGANTMMFKLNRLLLLFNLGFFCLFCFAVFNTSRCHHALISVLSPADSEEWISVMIVHDWTKTGLRPFIPKQL